MKKTSNLGRFLQTFKANRRSSFTMPKKQRSSRNKSRLKTNKWRIYSKSSSNRNRLMRSTESRSRNWWREDQLVVAVWDPNQLHLHLMA